MTSMQKNIAGLLFIIGCLNLILGMVLEKVYFVIGLAFIFISLSALRTLKKAK